MPSTVGSTSPSLTSLWSELTRETGVGPGVGAWSRLHGEWDPAIEKGEMICEGAAQPVLSLPYAPGRCKS